jgi:hypothetical protein
LTQRVNAYQPRVQPWGWDGGYRSGTRMVGMDLGHGRWVCIRDTDGGYGFALKERRIVRARVSPRVGDATGLIVP